MDRYNECRRAFKTDKGGIKMYLLNDLTMISGFSTRTLRNYIKAGALQGEKLNGIWQFTEEACERFLQNPLVKDGIRQKRQAEVFDFLRDRFNRENRRCVMLNLVQDEDGAKKVSDFFCKQMQERKDVHFGFVHEAGHTRVTLTGRESEVARLLYAYDEHFLPLLSEA